MVMVVSLMQGSMGMVILDFDKGFLVYFPPMHLQSLKIIGFQTLRLKEEMVMDLHCPCLLVLNVERCTSVRVYSTWMVASIVVRAVIK